MSVAGWVTTTGSLATAQVSLGPGGPRFGLYPVLTAGCPVTSTVEVQYPLRVDYRWDDLDPGVYDRAPGRGLGCWQEVLPPLAPGLSMGEGGTPLTADQRLADWAGYDGEVFVKDEGQNPTGSHKDRLNVCTTSAALAVGAPGVVVASSGNHGIAAAAYAARAGLPCVALLSERAGGAVAGRWISGHGAAVVVVDKEHRWSLVEALAGRAGFHPASNMTDAHTGHPHGPEGYKAMAYELRNQLGRAPGSVFVPTGYGEMLYGLYRGFVELERFGLIDRLPRLYACEPEARAPLAAAVATGRPFATVPAAPTVATGTACTTSSYRGVVALAESGGAACPVGDDDMAEGAGILAARGWWGEVSCGSAIAALRHRVRSGPVRGPVVCVVASRQAKNLPVSSSGPDVPVVDGTWESLTAVLGDHYGLRL